MPLLMNLENQAVTTSIESVASILIIQLPNVIGSLTTASKQKVRAFP
ncbi:hypothetical protein MARINOS108_10512 [Marinoscillum sp. 108]|nr:hypothetical protein MARINOS108_10512 [Marinoscillum sp. 108]